MDKDLFEYNEFNNLNPIPSEVKNTNADVDIFEKALSLKELNDAYFEYWYKKKGGVISGQNSVISVLGISRATAHDWLNRLHLRDKYHLTLTEDPKTK